MHCLLMKQRWFRGAVAVAGGSRRCLAVFSSVCVILKSAKVRRVKIRAYFCGEFQIVCVAMWNNHARIASKDI